MGVFSVCLIGLWFFWLLIDVWYPVFQLQGWQSLLQHRVQGEFHGRWDGRRWTHDISSCTSKHLTFGQWSNFPTDPLSENQQQLDMVVSEVLSEVNKLQPWMWSCLRSCCLKILFVRRWWIYLTYWFLCFAYLDPQIFWRTPKNDGTSGHIIILIGDGRVRLNLSLAVWTSFSVAVGCSTLLLLSCIWTYVFSMYFGKEMVNYDINKCYIS